MRKLIILLMVVSLILMSVPTSVFAVFTAVNVGPTTDFTGDINIPTGKGYYINGVLLAVGDITGAAASGANSDITSITGLTTPLAANYGGTGVANNAASLITITGAYGATLTLTNTTAVTLPTSGILVSDATACTDIEGTGLTITTGVLNIDDAYLLNTGDIGTGVYDFGGADTFEIPNKNADPAVTGQLILDTTVADMTNGNLAFYDGAAVRYVVSLAAADIWSTDDYVVAYDADADKFYMKEDADTGGFTGSFIDHFMDVDAADTEYIIKDATGDGDKIGSIVAMPDYARNITTTGDAEAAGTITITGTLADGTTAQSEEINLVNGTTQGAKAFCNITAIVAASTGGTWDVGIGDIIGLTNSISAEADIYYKTVDGVAVFGEIAGKSNTTNNTLDCATIVQNEDITIYYHP